METQADSLQGAWDTFLRLHGRVMLEWDTAHLLAWLDERYPAWREAPEDELRAILMEGMDCEPGAKKYFEMMVQ